MLDTKFGGTFLKGDNMSERIGLIRLEIGLNDVGVYCTTYLTQDAVHLVESEPEFKTLLDNVVVAVAKALTDSASITEGTTPSAWGPGADTLVAKLRDDGMDVELVDRPAPSDNGRPDLPVH